MWFDRNSRINAVIHARERTRAFESTPPEVDFHDTTIHGLEKCRAEAQDAATKRIFTQQIAIQEKRKVEARQLRDDARRRNAPRIG